MCLKIRILRQIGPSLCRLEVQADLLCSLIKGPMPIWVFYGEPYVAMHGKPCVRQG